MTTLFLTVCYMVLRLLMLAEGRGDRGGRVRPSSESGAPPLVEQADPLHDPRPSDLNITLLSQRLGHNLDLDFMSINRPASRHQLPPLFPFRRNRKGRLVPVGVMPEHLKELDLKYIQLGDGSRLRTRVPGKLKRKLQQLLWAVTACPVAYRWRDLGLRFWPRWLKEGHCPRASCSIPPGMKCKPSASTHKTLLRWHCRPSCHWIKVQYPVVTHCTCACSNNSYS